MPFSQLQHPSQIPFADGWKSNLKWVNPTRHSDLIFCSQSYNFCQNSGVFNMAAFSLPLFSTMSSIKLSKWYMLLCNNKNTLYKKRIVKMVVSSNLESITVDNFFCFQSTIWRKIVQLYYFKIKEQFRKNKIKLLVNNYSEQCILKDLSRQNSTGKLNSYTYHSKENYSEFLEIPALLCTLQEDRECEQEDNLPNSVSAAFKSYFNTVNRNYTNPVTPAKNTNACENQQMGKQELQVRVRINMLGFTSG